MISKHELYKIAIVSAATILMIVNVVAQVSDPTTKENTTIIWENATDICQGTPLSYDQLDAVATNSTITTGSGVPGTYYYDPGVGTVLRAGQHQPLTVNFVPSIKAAVFNNNSTKTVYINVNECPEKPGFFHETEYSTYLPFQWG
jgi:hypothetical protein